MITRYTNQFAAGTIETINVVLGEGWGERRREILIIDLDGRHRVAVKDEWTQEVRDRDIPCTDAAHARSVADRLADESRMTADFDRYAREFRATHVGKRVIAPIDYADSGES